MKLKTKLELAQIRNFNKKRITCTHFNLKSMLNKNASGLTREEQASIQYVIKITSKLLSNWPKTINYN